MTLCDYHTHSAFSADGVDSMDALCRRAVELGLLELAITDHVEAVEHVFFSNPYPARERLAAFEKVKENYGGKLALRFGIEVGQPHFDLEKSNGWLLDNPFDFVIASIHCLRQDRDLYFFDYNELDHIAIFEEYLGEVLQMVKTAEFDVVGHINYPVRYMWAQAKKAVDLSAYYDAFAEIFRVLVERGKGIEVNTSGLRQPIAQTLPPLELVKLYKDCGGEIITVGSDAHKAEDLGKGLDVGYQILKEAGFTAVTTFEGRKPLFHTL